jgi:hypothetical protein
VEKQIPAGYYTYAYISRKTGLPYYVGKGLGRRLFASHKKHGITTPRNLDQIVVLEENLTELGALALERRYIRWYGRKDNRTGILHNKTDGGETTIGHVKSQAQIENHRQQIKGRPSWTDGIRSVRSWECPGPGWVRGNAQAGKKWWNNGSSEVWCRECPAGWVRGRLLNMVEHLQSIAHAGGVKAAEVRWGPSLAPQ